MRTCVSFIMVNTAINKVNVALLQHETFNRSQIREDKIEQIK